MKIWVLDFETYFADDFTLRKLTTEQYCRDPRFEAHLVGVRDPDGRLFYVTQPDLPAFFASVDWSQAAIVAHHAQFDGLILAHHYGVRPALWLDTLSMARQVLGNHVSVALSSLAHHYGLQDKTVPYDLFKGRRFRNLTPEIVKLLGEGCLVDVELTWRIFQELMKSFPREELRVVDLTVRMFTEPTLVGDTALLQRVQHDEWSRKADLLNELQVTKTMLQSADQFTVLLEREGVEVEWKETAKGRTQAIAKTDDFMKGLLDHENQRVADLAAARLDVRSTINETRSGRFADMSSRGLMPVYLQYSGAHTTRWSGGDKCLTGDTKVLTIDISGTPCYKAIVDVLLGDLVWDGVEFVEHGGVVFNGYKEVIEHDGVHGTPEHLVLCGETWVELRSALQARAPIVDCHEPTMWEVEAARARRKSPKG